MSITAVIVDDEKGGVDGLSDLLAAHSGVIRVAGSASSGAEAVQGIERLHPDVVFLDVRLCAMGGPGQL
jgi:YesN/AraC family two-component response regulator